VDFLELPRWPVFNVADMGVFFGAVTAMWLAYRNIPYGNEMEVES
jgi:lipoprotein signal peptidase